MKLTAFVVPLVLSAFFLACAAPGDDETGSAGAAATSPLEAEATKAEAYALAIGEDYARDTRDSFPSKPEADLHGDAESHLARMRTCRGKTVSAYVWKVTTLTAPGSKKRESRTLSLVILNSNGAGRTTQAVGIYGEDGAWIAGLAHATSVEELQPQISAKQWSQVVTTLRSK
jgi:hypothetical protein